MIDFYFSGMYRGKSPYSSYRGRGRGRSSPNIGESSNAGPSNILIQHGNRRLIARTSNDEIISKEEYEEFKLYKQQGQDKIIPSFKKIVKETIDDKEKMVKNPEERVIIILSNSDKKWEDNPWLLCERYLINNQYPVESYKNRYFYESILSSNGCDIHHFTGHDAEIYNFSKIFIKKVIKIEEWGITPLKTKTLVNGEKRIDYNYWDYIQAFNKAFLYENDKRSHTWLIKFSAEVYNQVLPTWLIEWWQFYGTTEEILPPIFKELYDEWNEVIPDSPEDDIPGVIQMSFFIGFSIPWIWKYSPKTGYNQNKLFCLKRESYSRFWETMLRQDKETKELNCAYTINLIQDKIDGYTINYLNNEESENARSNDGGFNIEDKSREEILQHYMELANKALAQKAISEEDNKSQKSDTSMATSIASSSKNKFILMQDAQEPYNENDIQKMIEDDTRITTSIKSFRK